MKKLTFGTPEKLKPSVFCKGFNYAENPSTIPLKRSNIKKMPCGWCDYFTKEPVESGWHHIETDGIPVYERMD